MRAKVRTRRVGDGIAGRAKSWDTFLSAIQNGIAESRRGVEPRCYPFGPAASAQRLSIEPGAVRLVFGRRRHRGYACVADPLTAPLSAPFDTGAGDADAPLVGVEVTGAGAVAVGAGMPMTAEAGTFTGWGAGAAGTE